MASVNVFGKSPAPVEISQKTAFNEVLVAENTPQILGKFTYNINSELFTDGSTGSGTVTADPPFAVVQSGAASSSKGQLRSINVIEYFPGMGGAAFFTTIFDTPVNGNIQYVGLADDSNGLMLGYTNTDFCIVRLDNGTDYVTTQDNFNVDTLDGNGPSGMILDTTKGNVYKINYQWLGFGEISFGVENPETGDFQTFHRIKYANSYTTTTLRQPTLPFQILSQNTTNTSNVVVKVPSIGVYSQGKPNNVSYLTHSASNTKAGVTTQAAVMTIRNNTTYVGLTNYVRVSPRYVYVTCDGTKPTTFNFYKNPTLGGTPSFINFDSNSSVISVDKSATTVTGGILLGSFALSKVSAFALDVTASSFVLNPGDILTVSAVSTASTEVTASIVWEERFN